MPVRRALIEKRPWLVASIAAALLFYYLRLTSFPEFWLVPVKGAPMALLAAYAWHRHDSRDARHLAGALALASLADMAIEFTLLAGGILFFAYHLAMIALYLRHQRDRLAPSQKLFVAALLILTPIVAFLLPEDRSMGVQTGLYALPLAGMAAGAWASRFSRYQVGIGAVLFVISDLLIFAELGPLSGSPVPNAAIWPTYFLGQFLIATGIIQALRKADPAHKH
ncbi:lysoplasmalogenase family protein [Paraurantiacibacter namhicola]|uniref:YhhN-like protein n=1 Tax=Paraurantiacibacter namhicola TaxID=645517 RepID=A0A1C7D969_9SPHN|nr:lysoplasmalogenase family protein [Paraurantiacibacter namhicola]ANU08036.1 YhhN-like protein [Paraurantiacibacter namhicola]